MAVTKIKIGDRFGRLVVVEFCENSRTKSGHSEVVVKCKCDCNGNIKEYKAKNLLIGDTKSCGCYKKEKTSETHIGNNYGFTHGFSKERLYKQWQEMLQRCENLNNSNYYRYGARGIYVCDEWHTYTVYREWSLNNGYNPNAKKGECTLNRIDNDGPYTPWNCEWIDQKGQMNNTSSNRIITVNDESHTVSEWAEITGIKRTTLENRSWNGWDDNSTLSTPVIRNINHIQYNEDNFSIANWCYVTGLPQSTISSRIDRLGGLDKLNDINKPDVFGNPGRKYPINCIYFVDDNGKPISEEDYNNGIRNGRKNYPNM